MCTSHAICETNISELEIWQGRLRKRKEGKRNSSKAA